MPTYTHTYIYIYIYLFIYLYTHTYLHTPREIHGHVLPLTGLICTQLARDRETVRERERERQRDREADRAGGTAIHWEPGRTEDSAARIGVGAGTYGCFPSKLQESKQAR